LYKKKLKFLIELFIKLSRRKRSMEGGEEDGKGGGERRRVYIKLLSFNLHSEHTRESRLEKNSDRERERNFLFNKKYK
jgi:hypothetical protein